MFELIGCHGEHVKRPEEFRPGLERAVRAGNTALVNVVGDRTVEMKIIDNRGNELAHGAVGEIVVRGRT